MVDWFLGGDPPRCGERRGPRSTVLCELPPDHIVGRNFEPTHEPWHTGRSRTGRWYSWPPKGASDGGD